MEIVASLVALALLGIILRLANNVKTLKIELRLLRDRINELEKAIKVK